MAFNADEYRSKLAAMTDAELRTETGMHIYYAAVENAFRFSPKDGDHNHRADLCYKECKRRGRPDIYDRAYRNAFKEAVGYYPEEAR